MLRRFHSGTPVLLLFFLGAGSPLACNLLTGIGEYRACSGEECGDGTAGGGGTAASGGSAGTGGAVDFVDCSPEGWCAVSPSHTFHELNGAWTTPDDSEVWAVGDRGRILRYKDGLWKRVPVSIQSRLLAISGTGPDDVWVGGEDATLIHHNGLTWLPISGLEGGVTITGVWAAPGGGEAWATTDAEHVYRIEDGKATKVDTGIAFDAVSGTSAANVWFTDDADGDSVARWDGISIEPVKGLPFPAANYSTVWAGSAGQVWLGGSLHRTASYDGMKWTNQPTPIPCCGTTRALWGTGSTVWAAGEYAKILRWQEAEWIQESPPRMIVGTRAVTGTTAGEVWAVGRHGQINHFTGDVWESDNLVGDTVVGVWAASPDHVWAVTDEGDAVRWNGEKWERFPPGLSPFGGKVLSVGGAGPDDLWVTYTNGFTRRWDGLGWADHDGCKTLWDEVTSVVAFPEDKAWIAGDGGVVCRWEGTKWVDDNSGVTQKLYAIWGPSADDLWAFGESGTILRRGVGGWGKDQMYNGTDDLRGAWGSGPDDIYAVAADGKVLHRDSLGWSLAGSFATDCCADKVRIGGSADGQHIWVAGGNLLYTLDKQAGGGWVTELVNRPEIRSVWVTGETAWLGGEYGLIARRSF